MGVGYEEFREYLLKVNCGWDHGISLQIPIKFKITGHDQYQQS